MSIPFNLNLTERWYHFHEIADARMPFFGVTAIFATVLQIVIYGVHSISGIFSAVALAGMMLDLRYAQKN